MIDLQTLLRVNKKYVNANHQWYPNLSSVKILAECKNQLSVVLIPKLILGIVC